MKINKDSLQARIQNIIKQKNIPSNVILQQFFFESFIKRLANSKYSKNYVLKGGCLLSNNLGIDYRSTMDIDFLMKNASFEKERIRFIIEEICKIDVDDLIAFDLINIENIRQDDQYGGFKIILLGKLENIKVNVNIDIAVGDPITPNAINYSYKCLFNNEIINIQSYNFETILAEKLQTILSRGVTNSRCKDFYDIYIIDTLRFDTINLSVFVKAFNTTCRNRNTVFAKQEALEIVNNLNESSILSNRWNNYIKKNLYAKDVEYISTINSLKKLISCIYS